MARVTFLLLFIALSSLASFGYSESIEWLDVMDDSLTVLRRLEPAGEEGIPSHLYICRGFKDNRWNPGKLYMSRDGFYYICGYPDGREYSHTVGHKNNIQALVTPPGWASWVPVLDSNNLPPRMINGGTQSNGYPVYVCRHTDNSGRIFPGKYHENEKKCYYAYNGQKSAESNIEVLTLNMLGDVVQRISLKN